jgi:hypothetical protein
VYNNYALPLLVVCLVSAASDLQAQSNTAAAAAKPDWTKVKVIHAPGQGIPEPSQLSGSRVNIDPKTRRLRPREHDDDKDLAGAMANIAEGQAAILQPVQHDNGMLSVDLQGQFLNFSTVHIDANGRLVLDCVKGPEAHTQALKKMTEGAGKPAAEVNNER